MTRRPAVIFVTQVVDPADPVLGFAVNWIRALAAECAEVVVVANEVREVPAEFPAKVHSLGKETGAGRVARLARYERLIAQLTRQLPADAVVAHMCPIYLVAAAPVIPRRVRKLLWYAHPTRTLALRAAHRTAHVVLTSLPGAAPVRGPKVAVIGQATDVDALTFVPKADLGRPIRLLCLGRTSPLKGYLTVVRAIEALRESGVESRLSIVGSSTTDLERLHRRELLGMISQRHLDDWIDVREGVPPNAVGNLLREADCLVNAMASGSGDKVVFEAIASGTPAVVSNPSFDQLFEGLPMRLQFDEGDSKTLAGRLVDLTRASSETRVETISLLRERVEREHSLRSWASAVANRCVHPRVPATT